MILNSIVREYLTGKRFSNGQIFSVPPAECIVSYNDRLLEICIDKSVLHVGCADHIGLIEEKIASGRYLHSILDNVCKRLIGVDINAEAVRKLNSLGWKDVYLPGDMPDEYFDVLVAADVIEHVPNVNDFLVSLKKYSFDCLVITTPNAFRTLNRKLLRGELINTDHRYWFSPYTLTKILTDAGYEVQSVEYTDKKSKINLIRNWQIKRFPLMQDGLLTLAKVNFP